MAIHKPGQARRAREAHSRAVSAPGRGARLVGADGGATARPDVRRQRDGNGRRQRRRDCGRQQQVGMAEQLVVEPALGATRVMAEVASVGSMGSMCSMCAMCVMAIMAWITAMITVTVIQCLRLQHWRRPAVSHFVRQAGRLHCQQHSGQQQRPPGSQPSAQPHRFKLWVGQRHRVPASGRFGLAVDT